MWPRCCQLDIPLKDLEWKEGNSRSLNGPVVREKRNISKVLVDFCMCALGDWIFLQAWISSRAARGEDLTHYCEVEAGGLPLEQGCGWALLLASLILGDVTSKTDSQGFPKTFVCYLMPSNKYGVFWGGFPLRVDSVAHNMNLHFSPH